MMAECRYIALTDIQPKRLPWTEVDDIQSLVRLVLYANEIDIVGIVCSTSCFVKRIGEKNLRVALRVIDAYEGALPNLHAHADGWPEADYLRSVCCLGVPVFGKGPGRGFAEARWSDVPGVRLIVDALLSDDDRPLWVGLWGGANTLAQALWELELTRPADEFGRLLAKLRVYAISDQDEAGRWLRERYGERLFYIVTPTLGSSKGAIGYRMATWAGISGELNLRGDKRGIAGRCYRGARCDLVSNDWVERWAQRGPLGRVYPKSVFQLEGDTSSFLGIIPNGLNVPDRPELGGWGGRYVYRRPEDGEFQVNEGCRIWTDPEPAGCDAVAAADGETCSSPQASIWRWREAFQNDLAARIAWTLAADRAAACHPPLVKLASSCSLAAHPGEKVVLDASGSRDPDGGELRFRWFVYREAGDLDASISGPDRACCELVAPELPAGQNRATVQVVLEVWNSGEITLCRYARVAIEVRNRWDVPFGSPMSLNAGCDLV